MLCSKSSRPAKSKQHPHPETTTPLPTIAETIRQTTSRLLNVGIPSDEASIESRIIIRHLCGVTQEQLLANYTYQFPDCETSNLNDIIARREIREPLTYILGEKEFYGLSFKVDNRVLIPRPETEHLIELTIEFAQQNHLLNPKIRDIGTGSGIIAVTLAKEILGARIIATDISSDAIELARENAKAHSANIHFTLEDATQNQPPDTFDIIVSNPPYIKSQTLETLQPEVRDWEPRTALDGGTDGMNILRPLIRSLPNLLRKNSPTAAFIEIDPPVAEASLATARQAIPNADIQIHCDYAGLERVLVILC